MVYHDRCDQYVGDVLRHARRVQPCNETQSTLKTADAVDVEC